MNFIMEHSGILVEMILGTALIVEGIYQMVTGRVLNYKGLVQKYTPESLKRFVGPASFLYICEGALIILFGFCGEGGWLPASFYPVSIAGIILCVIVFLVLSKKYLVKNK